MICLQGFMFFFMFYYRNNLLPPLLLNLFVTNNQIHNYGISTASNYRTHLCRKNPKQFTILYQGPKIWNSLPISVTRSSNLLSFKTKMQEFLLKESLNWPSCTFAALFLYFIY